MADERSQPEGRPTGPEDWHDRSPESVAWYDLSVNWELRFSRDLPLICDVFGPPGGGGIVDAGCGTGRHAIALAGRGYAVTGIDLSKAMIQAARRHADDSGVSIKLESCAFEEMAGRVGHGTDGVVCIGNSLAAAGSRDSARDAVANFAKVLRPGGRLFIQVLNFPPMREEVPCVRGPRVTKVDGVEYVSVRMFNFVRDATAEASERVEVTNVTMWHEDSWRQQADRGALYPVTKAELSEWCEASGLEVLNTFGAYDRSAFDPAGSVDLILVAERKP